MTRKLYEEAEKCNIDVIKADFLVFVGEKDKRVFTYRPISEDKELYGEVLCSEQNVNVFEPYLYTWAGIYKLEFLKRNNVKHNETQGAAFQDNGFWFQTMALAEWINLLIILFIA